jgi:hypothetical protein
MSAGARRRPRRLRWTGPARGHDGARQNPGRSPLPTRASADMRCATHQVPLGKGAGWSPATQAGRGRGCRQCRSSPQIIVGHPQAKPGGWRWFVAEGGRWAGCLHIERGEDEAAPWFDRKHPVTRSFMARARRHSPGIRIRPAVEPLPLRPGNAVGQVTLPSFGERFQCWRGSLPRSTHRAWPPSAPLPNPVPPPRTVGRSELRCLRRRWTAEFASLVHRTAEARTRA